MPVHDNTPMDDRWKVGDEALCIGRKPWKSYKSKRPITAKAPQFGKTYKVTSIGFTPDKVHLVLGFAEFAPRRWVAKSFMKASPPKDMKLDEEPLLLSYDKIILENMT